MLIITQPSDYYGAIGETAYFSVQVSGENLSYQWQYLSPNSTEWKNSTSAAARTNTMSIEMTAARNGQSYRCIITENGSETLTSGVASVFVGTGVVLARDTISLAEIRDIESVTWYYKLQASTAQPPSKPTTDTPTGWSTTEPTYTEGSTNSLYIVQKTKYTDDTFSYSDVSLSTSYEASKAAYNKSVV